MHIMCILSKTRLLLFDVPLTIIYMEALGAWNSQLVLLEPKHDVTR